MVLPVVPDHLCVISQRRDFNAAASERRIGLCCVERAAEAGVFDYLGRNAKLVEHSFGDRRHTGERPKQRVGLSRQWVERAGRQSQRKVRGVGGLGKVIECLGRRHHPRRCEMEGVAVEPWLMCDLDDRVGDEINRHDVRLADLRADQRQPRGEDVACAADRLEEVVGAVDLVDLAGP